MGRCGAQPAISGHASLPAQPAGHEAGDGGPGRQVQVHLQHTAGAAG